jgi:hypothetical protein
VRGQAASSIRTARERGVEHRRCGKLIVATRDADRRPARRDRRAGACLRRRRPRAADARRGAGEWSRRSNARRRSGRPRPASSTATPT